MASWGDVNRTMNALVQEGIITAFSTDAGERNRTGPLQVAVQHSDGQAEQEVRGAVLRALARLGLAAEVNVQPLSAMH